MSYDEDVPNDARQANPLLHVIECCTKDRVLRFHYHRYLSVDPSGDHLVLSTSTDTLGTSVLDLVCRTLQLSDPLMRAMGMTYSAAGRSTWTENGLDFEWHFHPDRGLNLVITRRPEETSDPLSALTILRSLREEGLISDSDYGTKKNEILNRL